jgi:hypothetical protein
MFVLFTSCGRQKQEVTISKLENRETSEENSDSGIREFENGELVNKEPETKETLTLKPVEANEHVGKNAEVKGYVADVVVRPKVIYLNFDNKYPKNTFTAVIFPGDAEKFGDVEQYRNKNVTVRGRIGTFNGKPQIILNRKEQVTINN